MEQTQSKQLKQLIDEKVFDELKQTLGAENFYNLLNEFFQYCEDTKISLNISLKEGNLIEAENIAHNLKSASLVYGLCELSEQAKKLEETAKNCHIHETSDIVDKLFVIWDNSLLALKEYDEKKRNA